MSERKQTTITISGPMFMDEDGDFYVDTTGLGEGYQLGWVMVSRIERVPGMTVTVERDTLPTVQGSVIRATVNHYSDTYRNVLLELADDDDRPWRGIVEGGVAWLRNDQIVDFEEVHIP